MSHVLLDQYGRPLKRERTARPATNKYDAAQSTAENRLHWRGVDALSAAAANSPDVRDVLRRRSRYECQNNGYAKGLVRGRANDTIGVCPRLQLTLPATFTDPDFQTALAVPPDAAREIELLWGEWCDATGFADKLRLMDKSETREGEAFGVQITNPMLAADGPQLDLKLFEADQCSTPNLDPTDPLACDGIRFDAAGNPVEYHFLKFHPGDTGMGMWGLGDYERVPAERVYHLYDPERVGERRGVPALTPGLPLFNQLREYTLAALGAAKLAAMLSGVIEQKDGVTDSGESPEIETMDEIAFARNMLITLPPGATAKAFDGKQPGPSYREFKGELLTESGRSIDATRSASTGSSAEYNFSSARLDRLGPEQATRIRRDRVRRAVLDKHFRAWAAEALMIRGFLPEGLPPLAKWRFKWRWDGFASIDPVKDANASDIRMKSGVTTLERECAERGDDWEEVLEQQAREQEKRIALGLPMPGAVPAPIPPDPQEVPGNAP